jgi:2,4-dienoyl-CoA reductase-like NADH-dependent reductase (Old Yellow Enzyme family)
VGLDQDLMSNLFGSKACPSGPDASAELLRRFMAHEFDLVSVGRALIGDPEWVRKLEQGRYAEMRAFTRDDLVAGMDWEMGFVEQAHAS